jgi:hypothetical protein
MDMEYELASGSSDIELEAVAFQPLIVCQFFGGQHHPAYQFRVTFVFPDVLDGADVFSRNDQNMGFCLRMKVIEGNEFLVLIDDIRGDRFADDLTEDAHIIGFN